MNIFNTIVQWLNKTTCRPPPRGFPGSNGGKESTCQCRRRKRCGFNPWVQKIPWRRKWLPTPVFLPGECHRERSLAGYSPQGREESDVTEWQIATADSTRSCPSPFLVPPPSPHHLKSDSFQIQWGGGELIFDTVLPNNTYTVIYLLYSPKVYMSHLKQITYLYGRAHC